MIKMRSKSAFTLIELVIVIALIGAIFAFIAPRMMTFLGKSEEAKIKFRFINIKDGLSLYRLEFSTYPTTKEGLRALIQNPRPNDVNYTSKKNKWPFVEEDQIVDLQGNDFEYHNPPERYKNLYKNYELIYLGKDGTGEGKDIVIDGQ